MVNVNQSSNAFVPLDSPASGRVGSASDGASFVDAAVKDAWTGMSQHRNATNESRSTTGATLPSLAFTSDSTNKSSSEVVSARSNQVPAHEMLAFAGPSDSLSTIMADGMRARVEPMTYKQTTDGHGHQIRIGTRNGVANYCQDATGIWDSTDGRTWVKRESHGRRVWHGSRSIDDHGNCTSVNSDSGVTTVQRSDGTTSRSITDARGQRTEIRTNAQGVPVYCADSTGTCTSTDGQNWTNTQNGRRNTSTRNIDEFGQYIVKPQGGQERVDGRSSELGSVIERQQRLSTEYGIVFPKPGEQLHYKGKDFTLRPPTTEELDSLGDVLQRNRQMNFRGMQVSFVQSSSATDNFDPHGAYIHNGNTRNMVLFPSGNTQMRGRNGLEGTLQHELVRHEQSTRWGDGPWGVPGSNPQTGQLLTDFGWVRDQVTGANRILDKTRNQWQFNSESKKWDPIINGHPDPRRSITSEQMRDRALVKPATNNFNNPSEMHAEALSMFRSDRHQLFGQNRQLYQLMQQYDQREINERFGISGGQPRFIRGTDGRIVANTPQNRNAVTELENSWRPR